jgi:hypothetical protein
MRRIHFQVVVIHREGPRLFVAGRNCGDGLALGDVVQGPGGDVRIEAILLWRKYLNVLDHGHTGELALSGAAVGSIEPGCDLVGSVQAALPKVEILGQGLPHVRRT